MDDFRHDLGQEGIPAAEVLPHEQDQEGNPEEVSAIQATIEEQQTETSEQFHLAQFHQANEKRHIENKAAASKVLLAREKADREKRLNLINSPDSPISEKALKKAKRRYEIQYNEELNKYLGLNTVISSLPNHEVKTY